MGILILGSFTFTLAVWLVIGIVRGRRRPLADAIRSVEKELSKLHHDSGRYAVELVHARPLSAHMVKEIGLSRGLRYAGEGSRHNNTTVEFAPAIEPAEDADR